MRAMFKTVKRGWYTVSLSIQVNDPIKERNPQAERFNRKRRGEGVGKREGRQYRASWTQKTP